MKGVSAELVKRDVINGNLGIFKFKLDKKIDFTPGQFAAISVINKNGRKITRSYSMASDPKDSPNLEFFIRWVKKGGKREDGEGELTHELFSPHVDKLKVEFLNKAMGELKVKANEKRKIIFVCTGTGIAPFMSMLREAKNKKKNLEGSIIVHGVATEADLVYKEELEEIAKVTKITVLHVESRGHCNECDDEFDYVSELFFNRNKNKEGRVSVEEIEKTIDDEKALDHPEITHHLDAKLTKKNYVVMLCGNPAMINNMITILEDEGFKDGKDIISERYWV